MGLWDSIKKITIKTKCGVGLHGGSFSTPDGKPKCYSEKTCPNCMKLLTKKNHDYEFDWKEAPFDYSSKIKCTRVQKCVHCEEVAKKVVHDEYRVLGVDAKCEVIHACIMCGHEKTDGYEHDFVRDRVQDDKIIIKCINCGAEEARNYL